MKKFLASVFGLIIFACAFNTLANNAEEAIITLKPGLNVVSTPAILKGISFSNSGSHISFATLENHIWKAVNINNDNVGTAFMPLTGYIVRNDTSEDVTMSLSYKTNLDPSQLFLEKNLNSGWNLLGITSKSRPFNNITYAKPTTFLDFTDGTSSNQIITGNTFQPASSFALGKAYGVFMNTGSGIYGGENNYSDLSQYSEEECQEMCENNESNCPEECRAGVLSENSVGYVTLDGNNTKQQTLYEGTLTANKSISLNAFYIGGDNRISDGNSIHFYVYINDHNITNFTLDTVTMNNETYYREPGENTNLNAGETATFTIKAKFKGPYAESYDYRFKIGTSGNDVMSYKINSAGISFNTSPGIIVSEEIENAYYRADNKGILDEQVIEYKSLNDEIINADLAIILNNYAKTILHREKDTTKNCLFIDTESLTELQAEGVIESCQLGLIQESDNGNISLSSTGTLATISTLLSRALRNDKYNSGTYYYSTHLQALNIAGVLENIDNPGNNISKGDALVILMNSEGKEHHRRVINSYNFVMNNFNAVEDVYSGIRTSEGDRVIFIVRHSARENNCGENGGLTVTGIELAIGVGEKLQGEPFSDTSSDFYGSSYTKRTVQTSYYVGKGRGNENLNNNILLTGDERRNYEYVNHDNSSSGIVNVVSGGYFSNGTNTYTQNIYPEYKDIVKQRALYAIERLCNITEGHPFSRITSHDTYTLPITERATNESVRFSKSNKERPNFMQGIAIIVHEDGGWEVYPVKSLNDGKINEKDNPSCS